MKSDNFNIPILKLLVVVSWFCSDRGGEGSTNPRGDLSRHKWDLFRTQQK